MTSSKERQQRAAARAKLAREMAERQEAAKRRRQRHTIIGVAAGALVVLLGVGWAVASLTGDEDEPTTPPVGAQTPDAGDEAGVVAGDCEWLPEDTATNPNLQDVGTPGEIDPPGGPAIMTIATNHGDIEVEVDAENAPCTYASFAHLAGQEFYDDTICHRMTTEGIYVLQCGDPTATGMGGPTYRFAEENLPAPDQPSYPAGTMAMAKAQAPASTGSQFFLVYADTQLPPEYTVVGQVTEGLDIVEDVAADGAVDETGELVGDGSPATEVVIESLRVSEPEA